MSLYGYPQLQINFGGLTWTGGMAAGVSTISAIDSNFNGEEFLSFAQGAFLRIMKARADGTLSDVQPLLGTAMGNQLNAGGANKVPRILSVEHATIYNAQRDGSYDSVTVRFAAKTDGKKKKSDFVEDWTFQRPAATGAQEIPTECPSCGAPMQLDENGACHYCRVQVAGARGGWKLVRTAAPPEFKKQSSGLSWVMWFVIFVVLVSTVLPIVIFVIVSKSTTDTVNATTGAFGLGNGASNSGGPAVSSGERIASTTTTAKPTTTKPAKGSVSATTTFSGGITGTANDIGATITGGTGTCAQQAKGFVGLNYAYTEMGDVNQNIKLSVVGAHGPGDYDNTKDALIMNVEFSGDGADQIWVANATQGTVTLHVADDGTGTLSGRGLVPLKPAPPTDSASKPLDVTVTWTCE